MASRIGSLSLLIPPTPAQQQDPSDCKATESSDLPGPDDLPIPSQVAADIARGEMTDSLKSWLESQQWSGEDIADLSSIEGNEFFEALLEQAAHYKSERVFDLIPSSIVDQIEVDLIDKSDQFEALLSIIFDPRYEELEEAPNAIGDLPFLSRTQREFNRETYFDSFDGVMTEPLRSWLLAKEWSEEEVERLGKFAKDEFISELIFSALDQSDYTLIQSIPQSFFEIIVEDIGSAIEIQQELLAFMAPFPDLDE